MYQICTTQDEVHCMYVLCDPVNMVLCVLMFMSYSIPTYYTNYTTRFVIFSQSYACYDFLHTTDTRALCCLHISYRPTINTNYGRSMCGVVLVFLILLSNGSDSAELLIQQ